MPAIIASCLARVLGLYGAREPVLFQRICIRNLDLTNRIVITPMCQYAILRLTCLDHASCTSPGLSPGPG
jgi:hypothetical protein